MRWRAARVVVGVALAVTAAGARDARAQTPDGPGPGDAVNEADPARVATRAERYKTFLDRGRTSARAIQVALQWAGEGGFRVVDPLAPGACATFAPGDAVVFVWHDRSALFVRVGEARLARGMRLVGTHVDAPALRVLAEPIGAAGGTSASAPQGIRAQPYGGIKRFHYRSLPLALIGRVARADGSIVDVELGLGDDPRLFVPHAPALGAAEARARRTTAPPLIAIAASAAGPGARGASPRDRLHLALRDRFGVSPADLRTAELYLVPAEPPRDVGVDRALIGAYGHDDRVLSFAALTAVLELGAVPTRTVGALLVDREEIGSTGRTGVVAPMLEDATACLALGLGTPGSALIRARDRALARSQAISADVKSAINPNWPQVQDPRNAPRMGGGPTLVKYTGSRGKQRASDARPELAQLVREVAANAGVPLQTSETGRVDEGGGSTIAGILAERGIDVIDVGVPLLSMHAPFEVVSKRDVSACVDLFAAFFRAP